MGARWVTADVFDGSPSSRMTVWNWWFRARRMFLEVV